MNFVTPHIVETDKVVGGYIEVDGERYYRIANSHLMPEFFMSLVSSNDHWMFVSSHGGLSAGRRNPDMPLFPYYSADKISDMAHCTGPRTIIRIGDANNFDLWEPFANSGRRDPSIIRNLYKSMLGKTD